MNTHNQGQEQNLHSQNENAQKEGVRKKKRKTPVYSVDFAKIEDAPVTDFEKGVAHALAKVPSPREILIDQEEMEVLIKVIPEAKLSPVQRMCIELTLEGLTPQQISEQLDRGYTTIQQQMGRALAKLKRYLKKKRYLI